MEVFPMKVYLPFSSVTACWSEHDDLLATHQLADSRGPGIRVREKRQAIDQLVAHENN